MEILPSTLVVHTKEISLEVGLYLYCWDPNGIKVEPYLQYGLVHILKVGFYLLLLRSQSYLKYGSIHTTVGFNLYHWDPNGKR